MSKTINKKTICITGKIGSGKTEASKILIKNGYDVLIMDEYVHEIYKFNKIGYKQIKKHFGQQFVNESEVDRKKLGKLVFSDKKSLDKLNKIMIPIMKKKIESFIKNKSLSFVELGIYLDHEKEFSKYFDKVFLIKREEKKQIKSMVGKFPTISVGNLKKIGKINQYNRYLIVENYSTKKNLEKSILKLI